MIQRALRVIWCYFENGDQSVFFFAKMKVKDPIISSWTHNDEILVLVYNSVIWFILVVGLTCEEACNAAVSHPVFVDCVC